VKASRPADGRRLHRRREMHRKISISSRRMGRLLQLPAGRLKPDAKELARGAEISVRVEALTWPRVNVPVRVRKEARRLVVAKGEAAADGRNFRRCRPGHPLRQLGLMRAGLSRPDPASRRDAVRMGRPLTVRRAGPLRRAVVTAQVAMVQLAVATAGRLDPHST
jgi:hypothetical protein